jgi:hypothetical protein
MGQNVRRQNFESQRLRLERASPIAPRSGALKLFSRPQASQAIEKVVFGRENPRKSKPNEPSPKGHFHAEARLADDIQTTRSAVDGAIASLGASAIDIGRDAKNSRLSPCNPLKTHDRRRFAAENGGGLSVAIRAFSMRPEMPGSP